MNIAMNPYTRPMLQLFRSICASIVLLVVIRVGASGQVISGRVLQFDSDDVVSNAAVHLVNELGQVVARGTSADSGKFIIVAPRAGRFRLDIEALGYVRSTTEPFSVATSDTVTLVVHLPTDPVQLPTLAIIGERRVVNELLARRRFYEYRELYQVKMGTGRFFTPEAIDSLRNPPLSRLVHGLPNYRVVSLGGSRVDIRLRNGARPTLYIDGVRVRLREETFDQLIPAGSIGAVEVYWGANPHSPGPVIMVWTRMW